MIPALVTTSPASPAHVHVHKRRCGAVKSYGANPVVTPVTGDSAWKPASPQPFGPGTTPHIPRRNDPSTSEKLTDPTLASPSTPPEQHSASCAGQALSLANSAYSGLSPHPLGTWFRALGGPPPNGEIIMHTIINASDLTASDHALFADQQRLLALLASHIDQIPATADTRDVLRFATRRVARARSLAGSLAHAPSGAACRRIGCEIRAVRACLELLRP